MLRPTVKKIHPNITIAHADIAMNDPELLAMEVKKKGFDISSIESIKSTARKMEWLCIRLLLFEIFQKTVDIDYYNNGKPVLYKADAHISISHSKNKVAIAINTKNPIGVDIQKISSKLRTIKHKFLHQIEVKREKRFSTEELSVFWSAKEAIFKVYGHPEIFLRDILIEEFQFKPSGSEISGSIALHNRHENYKLKYELVDDYVLAYVLIT